MQSKVKALKSAYFIFKTVVINANDKVLIAIRVTYSWKQLPRFFLTTTLQCLNYSPLNSSFTYILYCISEPVLSFPDLQFIFKVPTKGHENQTSEKASLLSLQLK